MWYLALTGTCAVWVFLDARLRKSKLPSVWAVGTAVLGLIVLPIYLAVRPLKAGEIREGGLGWHVCKNFAILWAIVMGSFMVKTFVTLVGGTVSLRDEIQVAGMAIGFGLMLGLWLAVLIGAATIALLLKKSFVLEKGPTVPPSAEAETQSARSWLPWIAAAGLLSLIVVGLIGYSYYFSLTNVARTVPEIDFAGIGLQPKARVVEILGPPISVDDSPYGPRPSYSHDKYSWGSVNYRNGRLYDIIYLYRDRPLNVDEALEKVGLARTSAPQDKSWAYQWRSSTRPLVCCGFEMTATIASSFSYISVTFEKELNP